VRVSVSRRTGKETSWLLSLCLFDRNCSATVEFLSYRLPARIADSSSRKAVSFSSARTTKRFPSSRCASAIQIVRPSESMAETQPKLHPALLRSSAIDRAAGPTGKECFGLSHLRDHPKSARSCGTRYDSALPLRTTFAGQKLRLVI